MSCVQQPEQLSGLGRPDTSAGILSLYGEEEQMATSSYAGIDVSKDRLDVAVLGKTQEKQVCNTQAGIKELVQWMLELQPELIVVEATGGYQDRKSTRLNSSHSQISYAVFCLK